MNEQIEKAIEENTFANSFGIKAIFMSDVKKALADAGGDITGEQIKDWVAENMPGWECRDTGVEGEEMWVETPEDLDAEQQ